MEQHRNDTTSGLSKHARHCTSGTIPWPEPKILATFNDKKKGALQKNLLIRESLEIRRQKTSTGDGLNDPQLSVKTNAWDPLLQKFEDTWLFFLELYGGRGQRVHLSLLFSSVSVPSLCRLLPSLSLSINTLFSLCFSIANEIWQCQNCRKFWLVLLNICMEIPICDVLSLTQFIINHTNDVSQRLEPEYVGRDTLRSNGRRK